MRLFGCCCSPSLSLQLIKTTSAIPSMNIPKDYPLVVAKDDCSLQIKESSTVISIQTKADLVNFIEIYNKHQLDCVNHLVLCGIDC